MASPPTLAIFFGSTMGDTEGVAERIADLLERRLGRPIPLYDMKDADVSALQAFGCLLIGCSTWNVGELQAFWDRKFGDLDAVGLHEARIERWVEQLVEEFGLRNGAQEAVAAAGS